MRTLCFGAFVLSILFVIALLIPLALLPERPRLALSTRLVMLWSRFTLRLFRLRVCSGPNATEQQPNPRVIVANHLSYLDIPVLISRGPCVFLAKIEVSRWPLIGWAVGRCGAVFVDRGSLWSRAQSVLQLQKRLQQGFNVVIFPEGTTSLDGPRRRSANFFAGAFRIARMESSPIEMVYIDYDLETRAAWIGDDAFVPHIWEMCARRPMRVRLRSELLCGVHSRRHQREVTHFTRGWLLEGGRRYRPLPRFEASEAT